MVRDASKSEAAPIAPVKPAKLRAKEPVPHTSPQREAGSPSKALRAEGADVPVLTEAPPTKPLPPTPTKASAEEPDDDEDQLTTATAHTTTTLDTQATGGRLHAALTEVCVSCAEKGGDGTLTSVPAGRSRETGYRNRGQCE